MTPALVDANILLRYLTADVPEQAVRCRALFERAVADQETLEIPLLVIAETVWTLVKFYRRPRADVVDAMRIIIKTTGVRVHNKGEVLETLELFKNENISLTDAWLVIEAKRRGAAVCSFDRGLDRTGVHRREP